MEGQEVQEVGAFNICVKSSPARLTGDLLDTAACGWPSDHSNLCPLSFGHWSLIYITLVWEGTTHPYLPRTFLVWHCCRLS